MGRRPGGGCCSLNACAPHSNSWRSSLRCWPWRLWSPCTLLWRTRPCCPSTSRPRPPLPRRAPPLLLKVSQASGGWVARVPVSVELSWASVFAVPTPAAALATGQRDPSPSAPSPAAHGHGQRLPDGEQRSPEPSSERLAHHQRRGERPPSSPALGPLHRLHPEPRHLVIPCDIRDVVVTEELDLRLWLSGQCLPAHRVLGSVPRTHSWELRQKDEEYRAILGYVVQNCH